MLCLRILVLLILHALLNALVCCLQLNTEKGCGCYLEGGLIVIDVVGLRSMYLVVMP